MHTAPKHHGPHLQMYVLHKLKIKLNVGLLISVSCCLLTWKVWNSEHLTPHTVCAAPSYNPATYLLMQLRKPYGLESSHPIARDHQVWDVFKGTRQCQCPTQKLSNPSVGCLFSVVLRLSLLFSFCKEYKNINSEN